MANLVGGSCPEWFKGAPPRAPATHIPPRLPHAFPSQPLPPAPSLLHPNCTPPLHPCTPSPPSPYPPTPSPLNLRAPTLAPCCPAATPQDAQLASGLGATGPYDSDDDDMPMPSRLEALASASVARRSSSSRSMGSSARYSRPGSAVINLRGSRPNSAAIANEIEGFEDDFMVCWMGESVGLVRALV